jgi:heme a synthase
MSAIRNSPHRPVINWLLTGCFLIYAMVVIGCLTRLTHSGLSISDWSFMGSVPPLNEQMWQARFEKYQQTPEFIKVNHEMTLTEFKPIFMWEYVHRLTGRVMMYVFAIGFIYFIIRKKITRNMWPSFVLLFLLGALQAVIGWWMVYSGLQQKPAVSHYRLATHLMSAFTLFAFTFWFALRLINEGRTPAENQGRNLKGLTWIFMVVLILQIIYGAFTAGYVEGNDSRVRPGNIFNTWPKMGTEWMPEQVTMKDTFIENITENPSGIQFTHRMLAIVVVILLCVLWSRSVKLKLSMPQQYGVSMLIYGVTIQFILGVLTLIYNVPVVMGALHQTGAFFLFMATIYLIFHLKQNTAVDRVAKS